jgi:hypothetical protein
VIVVPGEFEQLLQGSTPVAGTSKAAVRRDAVGAIGLERVGSAVRARRRASFVRATRIATSTMSSLSCAACLADARLRHRRAFWSEEGSGAARTERRQRRPCRAEPSVPRGAEPQPEWREVARRAISGT